MKQLFLLFILVWSYNSSQSQSLVGGEVIIQPTSNHRYKDYHINLYYNNQSDIKDSILVYNREDTFYIHKESEQLAFQTLYKAIYTFEDLDYRKFPIIFIDTIDASGITNINNNQYLFTISYFFEDFFNFDFPEHSRESPSFDYPPNFINIDGSTASLSFKAHDISTDSVQYTTDQTYYEGTPVSLPLGFDFDSTNAILSWDTTMTGKYLINIGVIRNISGQINISATYRTLIIDTDMDNTLYVPVNTNAIEQAKLNITLHPNPSQNTLNLTIAKPLDEIRIYNQLGQLMQQESSISTNQVSIDVSGFSSGIYVVQIWQGVVWQSERFVKE